MNPAKVDRNRLTRLEDLPNVGPASAHDLQLLGIRTAADLIGQEPFELYTRLCKITGVRHDPCVLDLLMSVVSFMAGGPALPWWAFTQERKRLYPQISPVNPK